MGGRRQKRISRSTALYIPVCVLVIISLVVFGISVFTKVLEINVVGALLYTDEDIIGASGIASGDNMLFINMEAATKKVHTEMPFIRDVTITRLPPSAILIEVTETKEIAAITHQSSVLIIDSDCKILKTTDNDNHGLIEIRGLSIEDPAEGSPLKAVLGSEKNLQYLKDVLAAIEKENIEKDVSYIDVTNTSKINFGYLGRFRLILGTPIDIRTKLTRLPSIVAEIKTLSSDDAKGEIDMSDPAYEWRFNPIN